MIMKNHIVKNVFCRDRIYPVPTAVISLAFKKLPTHPQSYENKQVTRFFVGELLFTSELLACLFGKKNWAMGKEQNFYGHRRKILWALREIFMPIPELRYGHGTFYKKDNSKKL